MGPDDRVYPVVPVRLRTGDGLEVIDPAWPAELTVGPAGRAALAVADGKTALGSLAAAAQPLVDQGVLCPVGRALGR